MYLPCTRISTTKDDVMDGGLTPHDNRTRSPSMPKDAATSSKAICATEPAEREEEMKKKMKRKKGMVILGAARDLLYSLGESAAF